MAGPFYFAWVGGTVPALTLFSTRGNTHGAVLATLSITGDITAGQKTILNAANTSVLTVGSLYAIAGIGINPGTTIVYDGGNAIQLSQAAAATQTDVSFSLTVAIDLLNTTASLANGSQAAMLGSTSGLAIGSTYAIQGAGLALGTTFPFNGSAQVTLSLAAIATTNADVSISGTPVRSAFLIDNIQDPLLPTLTAGLTYNIGGPGIPEGAGFVAPASGSAITVDSPITDTGTLVPLVITGPRIADGGGWSTSLQRYDEKIVRIELEQQEGDFASLTIEVRNPEIGLLNSTRQVWCWLAWADPGGTVVPLFHGRLIGIPRDLIGEIIPLQFVAQPNDFAAQKIALAESMKVAPYWDPVWLQTRLDDPDTVLEAYSMLWHVDRSSLVVTASDIVIGEDGTIAIGAGDHLYEGVSTSYGQPPLTAMTVSGTVTWTQTGDGTIDLTRKIVSAFQSGGSPYGYPLICSLTGDGLKGTWPAPGTTIGGGWTVADTNTIITATPVQSPLTTSFGSVAALRNGWITPYSYKVTYTAQLQQNPGQTIASQFLTNWETFTVSFPLSVFQILWSATYAAARKRTETVNFTLFADLQPVLTDAAKGEDTLELNSGDVGSPIDTNNLIPIGDLRSNSYFKTDRGATSFQYLMLLARAKLRARARCVDIKFTVPWTRRDGSHLGIALTCRQSVQLTDYRLPGGIATGKVRAYRLVLDGEGQRAEVTMACCIGRGNTTATSPGIGDYAASGYMQAGYQRMNNAQLSIVDGELTYETFDDFAVNDDGVDLFNMNADTCLLNYSTVNVPAAGFSVMGDVTQGSSLVANLSDLSGFLTATATVKGRIFGVVGTGVPLGTTATYADGKLTLSRVANFFPGTLVSGSTSTTGLATAKTERVTLSISAANLTSGILQGGLTAQVNAIQGVGVEPTTSFGRDPIGGLKQMPTVITIDLPDLTSDFTTEFAPQVSPLMLPKTIDLQAAASS